MKLNENNSEVISELKMSLFSNMTQIYIFN